LKGLGLINVDATKPITALTEATNSFGDASKNATDKLNAGLANAIVQGGSLGDILSNVGKNFLSSVLNIGLNYLTGGISGALGVGGVSGGSGSAPSFQSGISAVNNSIVGLQQTITQSLARPQPPIRVTVETDGLVLTDQIINPNQSRINKGGRSVRS